MINCNYQKLKSFDEIIDKYDYFIFDCDGVIWKDNEFIDSSIRTIKLLKQKDKKVFFLSNTNKFSRFDLQQKINKNSDLNIEFEVIYTASYLVSKYISDSYPDLKNLFVIGGQGLVNELEQKGIEVFGGPENKKIKYIENFSNGNIDQLLIDENIHGCICGYDESFNYFKMVYASQVILKSGLFFGTNYDNHVKIGDKLCPGSYCFISSIETCTNTKAQIVTKPDPRSLKIIMKDHNIDYESNRDKILMIGDNLKTDIAYAFNNKIDSMLILTGVTSSSDLKNLDSAIPNPTYVLDKF